MKDLGDICCKSQGLTVCISWAKYRNNNSENSALSSVYGLVCLVVPFKMRSIKMVNILKCHVWRSIPIVVTSITCLNIYKNSAWSRAWNITGTQYIFV